MNLAKVVGAIEAGGLDAVTTADIDGAAAAFYPFVPLMRFEFQEGIGMAIRKEVLKRRGALTTSFIRPPGAKLDAATLAALDRVMAWSEVKK